MGHRIEWRDLTAEERRTVRPPRLPPAIGALPGTLLIFVLMLVLAVLALMTFAAIVNAVARHWDWNPDLPGWAEGLMIAVLWGPTIVVPIILAVRAFLRRYRTGMVRARDARAQVQVIALHDAKPLTVVDVDERSRYLFDLGTQTLIVDGSRLEWRPDLFGFPEVDETALDEEEAYESDGPAIPFPNSAFVLHRLPHSGRVLAIELQGDPQPPAQVLLTNEVPKPDFERLCRIHDSDTWLVDRHPSELLGMPAR